MGLSDSHEKLRGQKVLRIKTKASERREGSGGKDKQLDERKVKREINHSKSWCRCAEVIWLRPPDKRAYDNLMHRHTIRSSVIYIQSSLLRVHSCHTAPSSPSVLYTLCTRATESTDVCNWRGTRRPPNASQPLSSLPPARFLH